MTPIETVRRRFWFESVLAACSAVFALLTVLWRDWVEIVFQVDPDHHSGSLEWGVVAGCVIIAALSLALASRDWRMRSATLT